MADEPLRDGHRRKGRSIAQRQWNLAVGRASKLWEALTDEQRLAYNTEGTTRRTSGQRYFVHLNATRIRDGLEPLTGLPEWAAYSGPRVLKRFVITNRGGWIRLKLEVNRVPGVRVSVWGSRPCNRGVSWSPKCPRLGELPAAVGRVFDITEMYFRKHGEFIQARGVSLVGKRIFIRTRVELDCGPGVFEVANAVVREPEGRSARAKNT